MPLATGGAAPKDLTDVATHAATTKVLHIPCALERVGIWQLTLSDAADHGHRGRRGRHSRGTTPSTVHYRSLLLLLLMLIPEALRFPLQSTPSQIDATSGTVTVTLAYAVPVRPYPSARILNWTPRSESEPLVLCVDGLDHDGDLNWHSGPGEPPPTLSPDSPATDSPRSDLAPFPVAST